MGAAPLAEMALLAAVLMRATRDYVVGSTRCNPADLRLAEEARQWIFDDSDDVDHITSFRNICLAMNLDRQQVRRRILRMLAEHVAIQPMASAEES